MPKLDALALGALYAAVLWAPLASGAYRGWSLAVAELLVLAGLLLWVLAMAGQGRLLWRRTALDLPLALLIGLVLAQLAVGNGSLARWALAPPPADPVLVPPLPARFWDIGTVAPAQTLRSLLLFLAYVGVYVLVVNLLRSRSEMDRFVRTLLGLGGALGFLGLLDYLAGAAWLIQWRDHPFEGRVAGTFVNPDHFAAWLGMLICLGIGHLLARASRAGASIRQMLASRRGRERAMRRVIPAVGVAVMALALVFTLSRGGILSLLLSLVILLVWLGRMGRARRSIVVVGGLLTATVSYGAWIGLGPLLERVRAAPYDLRLIQGLTSLPLLGAFPLLGVGLGAYRDVYFRYQPPALQPGRVYWPFAHNDLLQVAVELGAIGTALGVFAAWRVIRDLGAAHLRGRGRCPVGAGEDEGARRSESMSVGLGLGALAAALTLAIHSAFDFSARIPANGMLGAACLGIATVALHTRYTPTGDRFLARTAVLPLGPSRLLPGLARLLAIGVAVAAVPSIVRPAWVETTVAAASGATALGRLDGALAWAPRDTQALNLRARLRLAAARRVWTAGETADGRVLASWDERRSEALTLLRGARQDLRAALALVPTDPFLHETQGWVDATLAAVDSAPPAAHLRAAIASLERAVALQPGNPLLYRSLAIVALDPRRPDTAAALAASRAAIERDPGLLPDLVERFVRAGLAEPEWPRVVPPSALDRLELASLLERNGLPREAAAVYRQAIAIAPAESEALARWMLAELLVRGGDIAGGLAELDAAVARDPDSPEIHLGRARARARRGDASALADYRAALARAEARDAAPGVTAAPFPRAPSRARALAEAALGPGTQGVAAYRRALAQYLTDRGLWTQALQEWDRAAAEAPEDARAHLGRGRVLEAEGDRARALPAYRRAVELDPKWVAARLRLAQALWETDQYYQAVNEWRAVIEQEPGNVEARLALARAYTRLGERALAVLEYQRILAMVPGHPEALRGLGR